MELLPTEIAATLQPFFSQEHDPAPMLLVKFFTPHSCFTVYVTKYDPADRLFFRLVVGFEAAMGYISLDE
ncbi:MAG: hypothetical protein P4L33_03405 [Capsulimonadaceae bacterium]|nr:hypothetical protein [Capsulimonadaceae bacterium]